MFFSVFSLAPLARGGCLGTFAMSCLLLLAQQELISQTDSTQIELAEFVVQATRANQNSPVPHTNLTAKQLAKAYHAQDVPFLLAGIPSVVETSDGGVGIGYTGLRIRGSDPTRINVTINGLPLNDAESQGVFWVDLPDLAASASEIQVQRGLGTSTNGAGAFGATLNLDLSAVPTERFATLTNTLGAFGTRKHALQVGTGLMGERVAFTARVSSIHSDGYVDRARSDLNSVHLSGAYVDDKQSAQFHLLSGHALTYQAWNGLPAQYLDRPELRTYNSAGTERPGTPHPDEVDDYTQRHFLAHYKRTLAPTLHLQLNGHYTRGFGFFEQYKAGQNISQYGLPVGLDTALPPTDLIRRRWLDNHFYGGTFTLRWQPQRAWNPSMMLGGAWSHYVGDHFGEVIWASSYTGAQNDFRYYDNRANKRDANVFLKMEASPIRHLTAFVDVQLRAVQYDFLGFDQELNNVAQVASLGFFNPKIGANYVLTNHWSAYTFLGVGHREPNRNDYTQSTPSSRPRAERMFDLETGFRRTGRQWTLSANFFWMRYQDQLVLDGRINDVGAYIRTNVPNSWRSGIEIEGNTWIWSRLNLLGNVALSQNKIRVFTEYIDDWDTGGQLAVEHRNTDLAFSPNLIARAEANFVLKPGTGTRGSEWAMTLVGKYVGKQFLDNTSKNQTTLPGYFFSDLRINYDLKEVLGKQLSVIFSLNNLFDAKFASNGWAYRYRSASYDARPDDPYTRYEGGDIYHQAGFFPQAGRHWMATLRVGF